MVKVFLKYFLITALLTTTGVALQSQSPKKMKQNEEIVTLGAGCFWCVEAIFERLHGVKKVISGYSGGTLANPTYKEVCSGITGHAEVVQVVYDPTLVNFATVLEVFFKTHDPTTPNRQGADVGTQYRSAIFYHTDEQKQIAVDIIEQLNKEKIWVNPIITEVTQFSKFYKAEDYHQDYFANNRTQSYCQAVITPKVNKFEKVFSNYLKDKYKSKLGKV